MRNHNIKKCFMCRKTIDVTKATTDKNHEFVRFVMGDIYFHKNNCFEKYEEELRKEKM
jgi:hypothetical protein